MQHSVLAQPAKTQGLGHDPMTIALHWSSAVLVGVLWFIGQTVDVFPNGPLRIDYRSLHIVFGVALALVLIARLAWRLTRGGMLPPLDHGILLAAARVTHWLLYALLVVAIGFGFANVWVRGDFDLQPVPDTCLRSRQPRSHAPDRRPACAVRQRGADRCRRARGRRTVPPLHPARCDTAPDAAAGDALIRRPGEAAPGPSWPVSRPRCRSMRGPPPSGQRGPATWHRWFPVRRAASR